MFYNNINLFWQCTWWWYSLSIEAWQ